MKELAVLWPIFQLSHILWESWLYTKTNSLKFLRWQLLGQFFDFFIFLRIMVKYPNWHFENFENWWVSGYICQLIIDGYLSLILRIAQHGFKPCHLVGEGVHIKLHMQAQIQQIKSKLIHDAQSITLPAFFILWTILHSCKKIESFCHKLNDKIIELFKVEGVRSGFYVANFGYFFKSNLRKLGKNGFSVFIFLFSKHLPLL